MVEETAQELAVLLGDLAIEMQGQAGTEATLEAIVKGAVDLVGGARWAGISMIRGLNISAEVPTDPIVEELDELQNILGEGPCVSALREHRTVQIDDTATDTRWPRFVRAAAERGVGSTMSFQLFVRGENLGALNLYADHAHAFDDQSMLIGEVLAQHASIAMIGAEAERHFDAALASRDIIGQAKGLLMQREKLTGMQAFNLLVKTSKRSHIKLVEIARWLVEQHEENPKP